MSLQGLVDKFLHYKWKLRIVRVLFGPELIEAYRFL